MRRAWRCDCDGVSHVDTRPTANQAAKSIEVMRAAISDVVNHDTETCPWRSLYDPLVQLVWDLAETDDATRAGELGDDPPALWLEALRTYQRAYKAAEGLEKKRLLEEAKKKHG